MGTFERVELSRNRIEVNIEAIDPNIAVRSGLRYYLDIFVPDGYLSTTYKKLITLEASEVPPYDQAGITVYEGAYFSIEKYLDSFLNYSLPAFGQDYISIADELTMPYRLVKRRVNGDVVIDETSVTYKYVLKAGIDENDYLNWRDVIFSDTTDGLGGKFLTWERGKRKIRPGQQVYLFFLLNHSVTPESLNVIAVFGDTEVTFFENIEVAGGFGVYCIPVSTDVLKIEEAEAEISDFSVYVADQNHERISEIAEFEIDGSYLRNERYIIYSNGLGGFDSLLCKGSSSETLTVTREESERYLPFLSTASYSERVINEVTGERELRISFGLVSDDELDKLRELMYAKEIYLQGEREFLPLKLTDEALIYSESDIYVRGRTFVFRYANRQRNFSRLGAAPETAVRATAWRGFGDVNCLQNARGIYTGFGIFSKLEKYYLDDSSAVIPAQIKSNVVGTEGYIGAVAASACAVTPFLSDAISRVTTFFKSNCEINFTGTAPILSIAAGSYGSTVSKADANAKAEAAWALANSQAFADANGDCVAAYVNGLLGSFYNYDSSEPPTQTNLGTLKLADLVMDNTNFFDVGDSEIFQPARNAGWSHISGAIRFSGFIEVPVGGVIAFQANADDGVRLHIDGVTVIDSWENLGFSNNRTGSASGLTANEKYEFVCEFFSDDGLAALSLVWDIGAGLVPIPDSAFSHFS